MKSASSRPWEFRGQADVAVGRCGQVVDLAEQPLDRLDHSGLFGGKVVGAAFGKEKAEHAGLLVAPSRSLPHAARDLAARWRARGFAGKKSAAHIQGLPFIAKQRRTSLGQGHEPAERGSGLEVVRARGEACGLWAEDVHERGGASTSTSLAGWWPISFGEATFSRPCQTLVSGYFTISAVWMSLRIPAARGMAGSRANPASRR